MFEFKNTVHPVKVILSKVTGYRREGSIIFVHDGGAQAIPVYFKTLENAEAAEKDFSTALESANKQ